MPRIEFCTGILTANVIRCAAVMQAFLNERMGGMYLHLGQDTVVRISEIVGIFDMENATISKDTRRFLADAQKGGRIFNVSMELPKSFVVCVDSEKNETVYISQISSATLLKRTGFIEDISK